MVFTPSPEIPVRIVNSVSNVTTSRCTAMLEEMLKPVSIAYCADEYTRDSAHYLESLIKWKEETAANPELLSKPGQLHLIAADVQCLYPRCSRALVEKALKEALAHSTYSTNIQAIIIQLAMLCMDNVLTQYNECYYSQKTGIVTGDNDSVSLANIAMRYVMKTAHSSLDKCELTRRFIDDIILVFLGSLQTAESIKTDLKEKFARENLTLTFRHIHSESDTSELEYMDVNHIIDPSDPVGFITKDFVKPTAVDRVFLHGASYHPLSTFKSILKGECLRMRRLNERSQDFTESLTRLKEKATKSHFPRKLTARIIDNASKWEHRFPPPKETIGQQKPKMIPWATAHPKLIPLSERQKELKPCAMITFKKPANLSTHLIHFRRLCHNPKSDSNDEGYKSSSCGKCSLCGSWGKYRNDMVMKCSKVHNPTTKQSYNLQKKLTCRNYGIYASCCQNCSAVYVGQTITPFKDRWSGHRTVWNSKKINMEEHNDQQALLKHYFKYHNDKMNDGLELSSAWKVIFLEQPPAHILDTRETHWRDKLENRDALVNIQNMVWPRVK